MLQRWIFILCFPLKLHLKLIDLLCFIQGSSKAGVLGEASMDFSNYAEATKVSLVSLPLRNSKTDAVLNVCPFISLAAD